MEGSSRRDSSPAMGEGSSCSNEVGTAGGGQTPNVEGAERGK